MLLCAKSNTSEGLERGVWMGSARVVDGVLAVILVLAAELGPLLE
jgi:hypothetical protein